MERSSDRIWHLEKKLEKKGLTYSYHTKLYQTEIGTIFFMTRDYAYLSGMIDGYKFYPLNTFLKRCKLIEADGPISYYHPRKGPVKQYGIQYGKNDFWKLRNLRKVLYLIKNAELGKHPKSGLGLAVQNDKYVAIIGATDSGIDDFEDELSRIEFEKTIFPFEGLEISKQQIRYFLKRLAGEEGCQYTGIEWRCGGKEFTYTKTILNLMEIPQKEQNKFIKICQEYGGYCDCEILMNAAQFLLEEDTPW